MELKAKPKQSLLGGAKSGRVASLVSRVSAPFRNTKSAAPSTGTGGQGIRPQNTFDSLASIDSQLQGSQVRLSTLLQSNENNDSGSDTASV